MANTPEVNPLQVTVSDITIEKFGGKDKMSLMPQFVEIAVYQSLFEPSVTAEVAINDQIGLFTNYPLTGEELITVTYKQNSVSSAALTIEKTLQFIIKNIRNITVSDRARSTLFVMDLVSPFFLQNTRKYVSHWYNDLIEKAASNLFDEYIAEDTQILYNIYKPFNTEETIKVRDLIVPNLRPYQGIQWLAKQAIAKDPTNYFLYLFYEDLDSFNFVTMQSLIEKGLNQRTDLRDKKYTYISDNIIAYKNPSNDPDEKLRLISNVIVNKRNSSIEKIIGGYYQNELFEINMLTKSYRSTVTELSESDRDTKFSLERWPLNTPNYIHYVKNEQTTNSEYANRIRYIINNWPEYSSKDGEQNPTFRLKFGNAAKYLNALNQIDLTITVPANMEFKVGDVIWVDIPENHGFNNVSFDLYISGLFVVVEVKQVLASGYQAATSLRIYKDGALNQLLETSEYNLSVTNPDVGPGHA
jgi:hypothetical protein